jgi:hypothetical protein
LVRKVDDQGVFSSDDQPEAAAFTTSTSTGKVEKDLVDTCGGNTYSRCSSELSLSTENLEDQGGMPFTPLDDIPEGKPSVYWDGDDTQSQQFDKLLDDIWERSQEYQEYFASEVEANSHLHQFQDNYSFLNFSETPSLWSPPPAADNSKHRTVKSSKTEGNMSGMQDSIPYVCVGNQPQPNQRSSVVKGSPVLKKSVNIEDLKAYKRSTSAYSNIKDYDINWQESFHEEQKSREKVAKTLKR